MWTAVWVITFEQGAPLQQNPKPVSYHQLQIPVLYLTLATAVRFFTDYLNGDVYYAQRRHNHNW